MKLKLILKDLLEKKDISVNQLSRRTSVPKNTLFNWLNGMKPKDVEQVKRVADEFGVSLDYLLFGIQSDFGKSHIKTFEDELNAGVFEVVLRKINLGSPSK